MWSNAVMYSNAIVCAMATLFWSNYCVYCEMAIQMKCLCYCNINWNDDYYTMTIIYWK